MSLACLGVCSSPLSSSKCRFATKCHNSSLTCFERGDGRKNGSGVKNAINSYENPDVLYRVRLISTTRCIPAQSVLLIVTHLRMADLVEVGTTAVNVDREDPSVIVLRRSHQRHENIDTFAP